MINKNWKILTGTTLSLLMSAVVIAPASAEYVAQELQPQEQPEELRQGSNEKSDRKIGIVKEVSDTTVTLEMEDGTSEDLEVSQASLREWQISEGSYVMVQDNAIVGTVERGTIRSVTNSVAEVELEDGDIITLDISQDLAANTEIKAGAEVFVDNNEIVAPAESMTAESTDSSSDTTTTGEMETETQTPGTTGTYESQPSTDTQTQEGTGTYNSQPSTDTQTQQDTGTYESQDDTVEDTQTEETGEPVRGMW